MRSNQLSYGPESCSRSFEQTIPYVERPYLIRPPRSRKMNLPPGLFWAAGIRHFLGFAALHMDKLKAHGSEGDGRIFPPAFSAIAGCKKPNLGMRGQTHRCGFLLGPATGINRVHSLVTTYELRSGHQVTAWKAVLAAPSHNPATPNSHWRSFSAPPPPSANPFPAAPHTAHPHPAPYTRGCRCIPN